MINKIAYQNIKPGGGFNTIGVIIFAAVLIVSCLVIVLMPQEIRGKVWLYNVMIIPVLIGAFLFKGIGGIASSLFIIAVSTVLFKQFGIADPAAGFGASFLSSGMIVECIVFFIIGIAVDFSDVIFGSLSTTIDKQKTDNEDLNFEISKIKKELAGKQAAIEENVNKVNFLSSKMVALQGIARKIGACLNIEELLKATLEATHDLLRAKKISIFLKGPDDNLLLKATYGWPSINPADYTIVSENEILFWAIKNNALVTSAEISKDHVLAAMQRESKFKTLMCAAISHAGEAIGVVSVDEIEGGAKLSPDDARLFSILMDFVSLSFKNSRLFKKVEMLANTDGLTKLYTHRFFQEVLKAEIEKSSKTQKQFSIILSDIDHFKRFNDTYGHQAGDYVLEQTAACFKSCVRNIDVMARYGGEEFIALLPETNVNGAYVMAERIRKAVESKAYQFNDQTLKVTVTLGVATFPVDSQNNIELVKKSDLSLYYGKENGRNRVAVASMIPNLEEWLVKKEKKG
ncbi:MAG TPA: sensor domain-containing diguanylate cyclase [Candidatus Wallbacteria bacterium]|nr:sensor domain-containing diguanylate cyclase [Candidatus Wallbacteria bacterium]